MKKIIVALLFYMNMHHAKAQTASAEIMAGQTYIHYQHNIVQPITPGLSWQHIATLIKRYKTDEGKTGSRDELMNQAYVVYKLTGIIALKGGLFYTNAGGFKPSIAIQLAHRYRDNLIMLVPRIDLHRNPSNELFFLSDNYFTLSSKTKLFVKVQAMSNFGKKNHNRSYQLVRIGMERKKIQFGPGLTLDEFGTNKKVFYNAGIFIRKVW